MNFGCEKCNRSFAELKLWDKLKNENYQWICTSCNFPLTNNQFDRKMEFGCRKCNHTFHELKEWGWLKFFGDHWKCLKCNEDITRSPEEVFKHANEMADLDW